jgi:hypothetical protein
MTDSGQLELPGLTLVRASDPQTSRAAALATPELKRTNRLALLRAYARGPATDFEAGELAGIEYHERSRRGSDLRRAGLIVPTGDLRPSPMGKPARVCAITAAGRQQLGAA